MTRPFIKRWRTALISISVLLAGYAAVMACAGGDWDDSSYSNYAPEAFVEENYTPFFFSSYDFYYEIGFDYEHDYRFHDQNIAEWSSFLGKSVPKGALDFLLNKASLKLIQSTDGFYAGKNELADSLKPFASGFDKNDNKQKAFIKYLCIAKTCEDFATNGVSNSWDYDDKPKVAKPLSIDAKAIETAMNNASDNFIKERYWFQLVRFYFFNDLPSAITTFDAFKGKYETNTMYYRTMAYAAGVYYKQKNYAKANFLYSRVFEGCDELKTVAHWSFHPQEEADWQQTLAMCTTNQERITLWQMLGIFYSDEMRSMKEIYKLDPSSKALDVLLSRKVNESENDDSATQANLKETLQWCKQVTDEDKISNPFIWRISTGYLAFLRQDYAASDKYYTLAAAKMPKTTLAKHQLRLLKLLTKIGSLKTIQAADEQSILDDLNWLYVSRENDTDSSLRSAKAQDWIRTTMAKKYAAQHDLVKSECFVSESKFYADNKNVEDLKALFNKKSATPYEKLCLELSRKKLDDLWEFQGIKAAYANDLNTAITDIQQSGKLAYDTLFANPFNGRIQDCHDCDFTAPQKIKYTRLSFLQKMKEMKDNVDAGKDIYNNAMLLANAFYNMSHYGNSRCFYESAVLGSQMSPFEIEDIFKNMLTDNKVAAQYYQKSLDVAANDEQKAKCLYMLSKCDRNEWYNKTYYTDPKNEYRYGNENNTVDFITWNHFKALSKYSNTKYYKDVIAECGYFKTAMHK